MNYRGLLQGVALAAFTMLGACGGGGGSGGGVNPLPAPPSGPVPTPTPAPVPAPTPGTDRPSPTPAPAPVPGNYNTDEYRGSVGPVSMNALAAYKAGATGANIKVAVVDSGIDAANPEFGGRISAVSQSTAGNGTIEDENGHGTAVAFALAARRNDVGAHGTAFDATLLVFRSDTPGSCATASGCAHSSSAIAQGIDLAVQNGARVINLSLGGGAPGSQVTQAISRATQAGVVIVISAGNDGKAQPNEFASQPAGNAGVAKGMIIIAGSVDSSDQISSFSNRAGSSANSYLAAVGENVRAPCEDTKRCLWSGTSFSAPQISGAVALLAQAFPNLTGAEIVTLLLTTARDAGATGIDAIYGHGILDLTRAFQPVGGMSVAGTGQAVSTTSNAMLSAPMGDAAAAPNGLSVVALDGFDRAYAMEIARTINRSGPARQLTGALRTRERNLSASVQDMTVAVTLIPGRETTQIERMFLRPDDATRAHALAASVTGRLGAKASFAIGTSETGTGLAMRLNGQTRPAFLVAQEPTTTSGFDTDPAAAVAVRQMFGDWGVTAAAENGAVLSRRFDWTPGTRFQNRFGYNQFTLGLDRQWGPLAISLALTRLQERETVLGARFGGALGAGSATSHFLDFGARQQLGGGWSLGGSVRQGWTSAQMHGGLSGSGTIRTGAFAADIGKDRIFHRSDAIGLRVAQPLRVASGGIAIALPAEWDYATGSVSAFNRQWVNLAPTGRELDFEFSYYTGLPFGDLRTNLFLRRSPGNFANLPMDPGMALRFTSVF